jgi:hypothetical protein
MLTQREPLVMKNIHREKPLVHCKRGIRVLSVFIVLFILVAAVLALLCKPCGAKKVKYKTIIK